MRGSCRRHAYAGQIISAYHHFDCLQAVDDDSVGDDGGDEENDEPVSSHQHALNPASRETRPRSLCFCCVSHFDQTDEDDDDLLETEVDTDVLPFKGIDTALKGEPFLAIEYASVSKASGNIFARSFISLFDLQ